MAVLSAGAAVALAGAGGVAHADTITSGALPYVGTGDNVTGNDDQYIINATGAGSYAAAVANTGSALTLDNGQQFVVWGGTGTAPTNNYQSSSVPVTQNSSTRVLFGGVFSGFNGGFGNSGTSGYSGDANLNNVLAVGAWGGSTSSDIGTLTVTGLTNGQSYEIQFIASDQRSQYPNIAGRTIDVSATTTGGTLSSGNVEYAFGGPFGNGNDVPVGAYVDWTFTASGTSQVFDISGTAGPQINAVLLAPVNTLAPEPASLSLLGVSSLALLALRRRSRVA